MAFLSLFLIPPVSVSSPFSLSVSASICCWHLYHKSSPLLPVAPVKQLFAMLQLSVHHCNITQNCNWWQSPPECSMLWKCSKQHYFSKEFSVTPVKMESEMLEENVQQVIGLRWYGSSHVMLTNRFWKWRLLCWVLLELFPHASLNLKVWLLTCS